jgi:hypothetical protein
MLGIARMAGVAGGRALRNHTEGVGLALADVGGIAPTPEPGGGTCAFDVAAVWCQVEVSFQDLVFRVMALELDGAADLAQLAGHAAGFQMPAQTGDLHG